MDLVYAKLDKLGEGTHGIVSLAVDLRVLARLRSDQACAEYRELAREMRMTSDERADLKLKRLQLDRKHAIPPEALVALKKIMVKVQAMSVSTMLLLHLFALRHHTNRSFASTCLRRISFETNLMHRLHILATPCESHVLILHSSAR